MNPLGFVFFIFSHLDNSTSHGVMHFEIQFMLTSHFPARLMLLGIEDMVF